MIDTLERCHLGGSLLGGSYVSALSNIFEPCPLFFMQSVNTGEFTACILYMHAEGCVDQCWSRGRGQ